MENRIIQIFKSFYLSLLKSGYKRKIYKPFLLRKSMINGNTSENRFEEFKQFYEEYDAAKRASQAKTLDEKTQARHYAGVFVAQRNDGTNFENNINLNDANEAQIGDIIYAARLHTSKRLTSTFNPECLEAIVDDAPKDKLAKNFASFEPVGIKGEDWHNERANLHRAIYAFLRAEHGDKAAEEEVEGFAKRHYVKEGLDQLKKKLEADKKLDKKTIEIVLNVLGGIYFVLPAPKNVLLEHRGPAYKELEKDFSDMFKNDDEKVKYATRNIVDGAKKLMKRGGEDYDGAAQMVASMDR